MINLNDDGFDDFLSASTSLSGKDTTSTTTSTTAIAAKTQPEVPKLAPSRRDSFGRSSNGGGGLVGTAGHVRSRSRRSYSGGGGNDLLDLSSLDITGGGGSNYNNSNNNKDHPRPHSVAGGSLATTFTSTSTSTTDFGNSMSAGNIDPFGFASAGPGK